MANLSLIKEIAEEKGIKLGRLAEGLGMTPTGFSLILRKNNTDIVTLEKISRLLNVNPVVFFDNAEVYGDFTKDEQRLQKTTEDKETLLQLVEAQKQLIEAQRELLLAKRNEIDKV